ncbi:Ran-binding protein [Strigomonas culicis]|uniref:Ran-binding protein n=1 Tax=Strigomonas culicis TaxID=28005 RepID=S9VC81_9TRYP|nr:Ran-binding protein [Strigomonas culicis]|eukprot:EPY20635.1 Ran-binding protein [Strigomonas culicis]
MEFKTIDLYGGAMRCAVPCVVEDMSAFRQVPDHQEVWSDPATGCTVIVELLARQERVSDGAASDFFYRDLAKDNGCSAAQVQVAAAAALPPAAYPRLAARGPGRVSCAYGCLTTGTQLISKYTNEQGKESEVFVGLVVLRLPPPVATEVLVSVSAPVRVHPDSSDARKIERLLSPAESTEVLRRAVESLEIVDDGLFVAE